MSLSEHVSATILIFLISWAVSFALDTPATSDSSEVWVARGMRLLGGELEHTAGTTFKLNEGKWLCEGRYVEFDSHH